MEIIKRVENILKSAGIEEYKQEAKLLVVELSGFSYEQIILGKQIDNEDEIIEIAKKRAQDKIPIQYLLGFSYFMGEKYKVNENVLIPRDETEFLVNQAYELIKNKDKINILDIGIGSGCISCALALKLKNKDIEILGVDISSSAICCALENVENLGLIRKIVLRKSDLFSKIRDNEKFDLIISNPPYIPICEKNNIQYEVAHFEPACALFAQDIEGISFYEKIIKLAPNYLKPQGYIAFECGVNQADKIKSIFEQNFENIEITLDLANIERVISAKLKY